MEMTPAQSDKFFLHGWGVSVLLHAVGVACAVAFVAQVKPVLKEDVFQWEVSLVQPADQVATAERNEPITDSSASVSPVASRPMDSSSSPTATAAMPPERAVVAQPAPRSMVVAPPEPAPIAQRDSPPAIKSIQPLEQKMEPVERKDAVAEPAAEPVERNTESIIHQPTAAAEPEPVKAASPVIAERHAIAPVETAEAEGARPTPPSMHTPPASVSDASHPPAGPSGGREAEAIARSAEPTQAAPTEPGSVQTEAPVQVAKVAPSGSEVKADHRWLAESLWRRVAELKRYPSSARLNGLEGKVVLKAVIRSDGQLAEVSVQKSSGHAVLDEAAMEAVKLACPLHMKQELGKPQIVVSLPIVYSLR